MLSLNPRLLYMLSHVGKCFTHRGSISKISSWACHGNELHQVTVWNISKAEKKYKTIIIRSFSLSPNKHGTKNKLKPSCRRSQENEISQKTDIYKQFVQVSGLCRPQFQSYLTKRFTHHCRALYGDAIFVYSFGTQIGCLENTVRVFKVCVF